MQNYSNYELNRCGKTNLRYLLPRPGSSDGRASDLEIRRSQARNLPGSFVSSIKSSTMAGAPQPGRMLRTTPRMRQFHVLDVRKLYIFGCCMAFWSQCFQVATVKKEDA